jgi:DNA invertase Pin-like site-specific DNA recombinase
MKSVIYTRVSTNEQSAQRQINDLKTAPGFEVVKVFSENISGFTKSVDEREQLQAMLRCVDQHSVECVMISEISRLGRNTHETLALIKDLEKKGIKLYIHNLRMTLGADDAKDRIVNTLIVTILTDLARLESENLSYRIKSGIRARKASGLHTGRKVDSAESIEKFLAKHKKAIKLIKLNRSYNEIKALTGTAPATVIKIKRALEQLQATGY